MPWGTIGGAVLGGGLDLFGAERTNQANAKQAALNRDFQERMSNTAHRRQVADMRAAGLNPILSGMGGSGASQPGGSQATSSDMGSIGSRAITSAKVGQQAAIDRPKSKISQMVSRWLNKPSAEALVAPAAAGKMMGLSDKGTAVLAGGVKAAEVIRETNAKEKAARDNRLQRGAAARRAALKAKNSSAKSRSKEPFGGGKKVHYIDLGENYAR